MVEKYEGTKLFEITPKDVYFNPFFLYTEDYPLIRWLTYEQYNELKDDYIIVQPMFNCCEDEE